MLVCKCAKCYMNLCQRYELVKCMELFMNMWTDYALRKIDIVCYMLKTANMLNYESMPLLMTVQKGINKCLRYKKAVNWYPRH